MTKLVAIDMGDFSNVIGASFRILRAKVDYSYTPKRPTTDSLVL